MDAWLEELRAGRSEPAWALFIDRYRRLIFSAIRHFANDPDDVMDVFACVCESLRERDLARLRHYAESSTPGARFSTWLVAVVRNRTVDWFRHRDGRPRHRMPANLTMLQQRIYHSVFIDGSSHEECFHRLQLAASPPVSTHEFSEALRTTYRLAGQRGGARAAGDAPAPTSAGTPEQQTLAADAGHRVTRLLEVLDPADRLAVQLFVVDELAAAEVARIVGWPNAKMVYNRVSRALTMLRHELARSGIGLGDL